MYSLITHNIILSIYSLITHNVVLCRVRNTRKVRHWGRGDDDDDDDDDDGDDDGLMISFLAKGGKCYCSVSYRTGVCLRICP